MPDGARKASNRAHRKPAAGKRVRAGGEPGPAEYGADSARLSGQPVVFRDGKLIYSEQKRQAQDAQAGRTIALDLATTTGFAISGDGPVRGRSGVITFYGSVGHRLCALRDFADDLCRTHNPRQLVAEQPIFRGRSTYILVQMLGVLEMICFERGLRLYIAPPTKIKKWATGSGAAKKDAMVRAAKAKRWQPIDDNHADAMWLLDFFLKGPLTEFTLLDT